jgi:flagellar protein FliS
MRYNAQNAYLESRILAAEPLELVRLLYQAASRSVRDARQHLADGGIAARSKSINRVCDILYELNSALDHERGGEISRNLSQLYAYMHRKLIEANLEQADAPLAEVLGLLATLEEAWNEISQRPQREPERAACWANSVPLEEPAACAAGWSL